MTNTELYLWSDSDNALELDQKNRKLAILTVTKNYK